MTVLSPDMKAESASAKGKERRLTLRLAAYWQNLCAGRAYPALGDFEVDAIPEFLPRGFVLDFGDGIDNPIFRFIGAAYIDDCGMDLTGQPISAVPRHTLLVCLTDYFLQVFAAKSALAFEGDFPRDAAADIHYRGILLPLSEDGETIDYIVGAINGTVKSSKPTSPSLPPPSAAADAIREPQPSADAPEAAASAVPAMDLAASLAYCRDLALSFEEANSRSRKALYQALAGAYAFYFATEDDPEGYHEILADAGLPLQVRAPFTPIVKLIFGDGYDKTRLSEYSAALSYAKRTGRRPEAFDAFLAAQPGGIKGCVEAERAVRRGESAPEYRPVPESAARVLRKLPAIGEFPDPGRGESEFVLVLGHRDPDRPGVVAILDILDEKPSIMRGIVRRAAKKRTASP